MIRIRLWTSVLGLVLLLCPVSAAQLTDLQPGENFPSFTQTLGFSWSEQVDTGDVDQDGDLDLVIANGGNNGARANRIFINQGGLQGGTIGAFVDETSTRFAGISDDGSRDVEFIDLDNDGDLDLYISNQLGSTGQESRFLLNMGGAQGGTVGHFIDDTLNHWGTLVSVPLAQQHLGGDFGPFNDWTCDCDFADLDNDGDLDLFHSSYGPFMQSGEPSRVFLNDGSGVFNELWPWIDDDGDIELHCQDLDLADFDMDGDIDIFATSRDTHPRIYVNNLYNPIGPRPFHDITQFALIDSGTAWGPGPSTYEVEYTDLDADGDFDVWMANWETGGQAQHMDRILRNDGAVPGQGFFFTKMDWIRGEVSTNTVEIDFIDYDSDGDLDVIAAPFVNGSTVVYQNGANDGLDADRDGLFHRNGTTDGGSLASWSEFSLGVNAGGDVEEADLDNDGDPDLLLTYLSTSPNRVAMNVLGVPDTHSPFAAQVLEFRDPGDADDVIIVVKVFDNSAYYTIRTYDVTLDWTANGVPAAPITMTRQGGQQFRGVIPDALQETAIDFDITMIDRAGNQGVHSQSLELLGAAWTSTRNALAGSNGLPLLTGGGVPEDGFPTALSLSSAQRNSRGSLVIGVSQLDANFKGGVLVPSPDFLVPGIPIDSAGEVSVVSTWPAGMPSGLAVWFQYWMADAAGPLGFSASNGLRLDVP